MFTVARSLKIMKLLLFVHYYAFKRRKCPKIDNKNFIFYQKKAKIDPNIGDPFGHPF